MIVLLVMAGLICLSLSQSAHQRQLSRRALHRRHTYALRTIGAALLLAAAWWAAHTSGWAIGLAVWCGAVSVCAAVWVFSLPWLVRRLYSHPS
jgi:hypothetical protein